MNDDRFERAIAWVLAAGVIASAVFIAAGVIGSFLIGWDASLIGRPVPVTAPTDFGDLLPRLVALQPLALSQAGLLLLMATPVVRVVVTAVGFVQAHDRLYAALSGLVLLMLVIGFALGARQG
jgi:uncharacterized membrane protein